MILMENHIFKSEQNMVLETIQMSPQSIEKAEKDLNSLDQSFNGGHGNVESDGIGASFCLDNPKADNLKQTQTDMIHRMPNNVFLQKFFNNEVELDDDDDDDTDWEPFQKKVTIMKWFCTNCTMVNVDDAKLCNLCGENKESGILKHGFYASPILQEQLSEVTFEKALRKCNEISFHGPTSGNSTLVGFDKGMLLHSEVGKKSRPHPERPDRLQAIAASLRCAGIFPGRCYPISAREITRVELMKVHSLQHIEAVEVTSHIPCSYFTSDTYANEHSARAARLAAGLCADLASAILLGRAKNGFALVRPPGHHAGVGRAMGFCLHNNAAIAAFAALFAGAKKILIVDWDVHHGNGTQEIFDRDNSVLYISLHRHEDGKFYPGTGAVDEVGTMGAEGFSVNIPWSQSEVGDNDYIFAFKQIVLPIATAFSPDITIISAGFDAARGDPLGCCDVTPDGFAQMTHMLNGVSRGKLLIILEGGYNLRSISASATAVIKVLLGDSLDIELDNAMPTKAGLRTVLEVLKVHMSFWPTLKPIFTKLQSEWDSCCFESRKIHGKKMKPIVAPEWWKWGPKRFLYDSIRRHYKKPSYC